MLEKFLNNGVLGKVLLYFLLSENQSEQRMVVFQSYLDVYKQWHWFRKVGRGKA